MRARLLCVASCLIVLSPLSAAVTGTVMGPGGDALPGAKVMIFAPEDSGTRRARMLSEKPDRTPLQMAQSDAKGRFRIEGPKELAVLDLYIAAESYAPASFRVEKDEEMGGVALTAAPLRTGRITADGKPVAAARVLFTGAGQWSGVTDEQGRYSAPDPSKWAQRMLVVHPAFALLDEAVVRPERMRLDRTLQKGISVTGRVLAEDGKTPVAGASIHVDGWELAKSSDDGSFTLSNISPRWERLEARHSGRVGLRTGGSKLRGEQTLRLTRAPAVAGAVRDLRTNAGLSHAEIAIRLARFASEPAATVLSDAKGAYTFPPIPPGSYEMFVIRPGYGFMPTPVTVAAGERLNKVLGGTQLARVSGTVVSEEKQAVGGARIRAERISPDLGSVFPRILNFTRSGVSAPDGAFVLTVEPESDLRLEGTRKGYPSALSGTMRLGPGERKAGVVLTIPAGLAVQGRVLDRQGKPIAGATVAATPTTAVPAGNVIRRVVFAGMRRAAEAEEEVRTDSEGRFSLRLKEGRYDFIAQRDDFAPAAARAQQVTASTAPIEITLEPAVEIQGRVVRGGVGLAGARVFVNSELSSPEQVETGGDGSFRVTGLAPGSVMLNVTHDQEFTRVMRQVTAPASDLLIEVPPVGQISGRVLDKTSKQPITAFEAGITPPRGGGMMVFGGPGQSRSFTAEDGSFLLESVPAGAHTVMVTAPGYTPSSLNNVRVEEGKGVDIEILMDRGVRVSGRVTGPDGSPLAGVAVRQQRPGAGGPRVPSMEPPTVTDSAGEYMIEAVEAGERTFAFSRTGYVTTHKSATLSGESARIDAQLSSGVKLTGMVVSEGGSAVAEARVTAESAAESGMPHRSAITDGSGSFTLEGLVPGRYNLSAAKDGFADARVRDVDVSAGVPLRIVLPIGGTIVGRVTGLSARELAGTTVSASNQQGFQSTAVDPHGNYRIEGAPTGTVRLSARTGSGFSESRTSPAISVQVEPGATVQQDVEFPTGTVIRGRVTRDGAPLAGVQVQFVPRAAQSQTFSRVTTDNRGIYEVTGLSDALYTVSVSDPQRGLSFTQAYEVRGSGTFDINVEASALRGRVVDAGNGEGVSDARIEIRERGPSAAPFAMRSSMADSSGSFAMDSVPPGDYHLRVEKEGYAARVIDLSVGSSAAEVEVKLERNAGVLLRVVDARDGRPLSAHVRVLDAQERVIYETPFGFVGGSTEMQRLPLAPGNYTATVVASGYALQRVNILSPSSPTVSLTPGGSIVVQSRHSTPRRARLLGADGRALGGGRGPTAGLINIQPGQTVLNNIAPGVYTLQLLGEGDGVVDSTRVTVVEGQRTTIDI